MNLILLDSTCHKQKLPSADRRSVHIRKIFNDKNRENLFVGFPDGPMGKAKVTIEPSGEVNLDVEWMIEEKRENEKHELSLLIPYCRPQTCRKILREAASVGIKKLVFFRSDKSEAGYAESSLWKTDEWKQQVEAGVEQAFVTGIPLVERLQGDLEEAIQIQCDSDGVGNSCKIVLDNYEASALLGPGMLIGGNQFLAVGSERGWSGREREIFKASGYVLAHMGHRVMRTETAIVAACSVIHACIGNWTEDTAAYVSRFRK